MTTRNIFLSNQLMRKPIHISWHIIELFYYLFICSYVPVQRLQLAAHLQKTDCGSMGSEYPRNCWSLNLPLSCLLSKAITREIVSKTVYNLLTLLCLCFSWVTKVSTFEMSLRRHSSPVFEHRTTLSFAKLNKTLCFV